MRMSRRRFGLNTAAGLALSGLPGTLWAAEFPTRPITLINPFSAGGPTDIFLRPVGEAVARIIGQPVIVDVKAGASGTLGPATMAAAAKPDGYTIGAVHAGVYRLPYMQKVSFDPLKDFTYIANISSYATATVVRTDSPWKTWQGLLDYCRAHPGEVTYGTTGVGSIMHLAMERFAFENGGVPWRHVPFKGSSEIVTAVAGGHVMVGADTTNVRALVEAGQLRMLNLWTRQRLPNWPGIPTLIEMGYNINAESPIGLAGPKGMDPAVVKILQDAFKASLDDAVVKGVMDRLDQPTFYLDTKDFNRFVVERIAEEQKTLKMLGLFKET
jgi:tripartite-type tricarboxylate transporter receptor subunit TctC